MASASLMSRLPEVRGSYKENAPLAPLTWFRVGGKADVLYMPADADDLAAFLADWENAGETVTGAVPAGAAD